MVSVPASLRLQVLAPAGSADAKALHRQGQPEQLELLLGLDPEHWRRVLQQALCLLSWSKTEYQSLAMLEALACGCPVVARPRGWLCHGPIPGVLVARSRQEAVLHLTRLVAEPAWRAQLELRGGPTCTTTTGPRWSPSNGSTCLSSFVKHLRLRQAVKSCYYAG